MGQRSDKKLSDEQEHVLKLSKEKASKKPVVPFAVFWTKLGNKLLKYKVTAAASYSIYELSFIKDKVLAESRQKKYKAAGDWANYDDIKEKVLELRAKLEPKKKK